jgi:NADPH-dependent 2,4-dienoyl-CoA reductase/sulfur reductase-like enzyme
MKRILVVGASLAGLRGAEALRREGFDGELTILGAEPHHPYDRPPLSKEILTGEMDAAELALPVDDELEAEWLLGDPATALDLHERTVHTQAGRAVRFDGLLIATGSRLRRLPGLEPTRTGIHELRTLEDAIALKADLRPGARVVIVGAGFVGAEVASAARAVGAEVDVVSLDAPLVLAGPLISGVCGELLHEAGVRVHAGRSVARVIGDDAVRGVHLDDGTELAADVLVSAVGAEPATGWLEGSGITLDRGVSCDASCAVMGTEGVVAAGDVARWPNPRFGGMSMRIEHWTNAVEMGTAAAKTLLHGPGPTRAFASVPSFWSDHCGVRLQSVGLPLLGDRVEVVDGSLEERRFVAAAYRGERLVGAMTYGMVRGLARYRVQLARSSDEQPVLS